MTHVFLQFRLMWKQIRSFVLWLHQAEHVARFQHAFGVVPQTTKSDQNADKSSNLPSKVANGLIHRHHERKVTYDTHVLDEYLENIVPNKTPLPMDWIIR